MTGVRQMPFPFTGLYPSAVTYPGVGELAPPTAADTAVVTVQEGRSVLVGPNPPTSVTLDRPRTSVVLDYG